MAHVEMSAMIGAMIVHAAAARGAAPAAMREATGFDPARGLDPDARISLAEETSIWEEAVRQTGDDAFGLHAAEMLRPGAFDVLDYAVRTAPTLRASVERLARYNRLVHDVAVFSIRDRGDVMRIEHGFRVTGPSQCRHSAEFTIASLVVIGTQLLGEPLRPRAVEFRHSPPASPEAEAEHRRVFGVAPRFSMPANALEIDRALSLRPLVVDAALSRLIERHAESLLAASPRRRRRPRTACGARSRRRSTRGHDLKRVAAQLRMSERSLQRRLADEGESFDAIVDALRRDLALRYLADPKIAVAEVAYLLGYSEPSPFHRAFKRWTGRTPAEARRGASVPLT
ncbi:MAG: AraC family transcriptional regulator [Deltaproteobacteria bacterium]|nr:AraC family transcriptional regulator [Deltaproteobacteria bacterium]